MTSFHSPLNYKATLFMLLISCIIYAPLTAQYGPIGIGNSDGSDGQPKLLLWLDGTSPTVAEGSNVLVWPDKSGNGNDFTAVAATSPILRSGGPASRPYLEFSRANNRMVLQNLEFTNQGVSIFYVFKTSDVNYGMFSFAESDANPKQILTNQLGTASGCYKFSVNGNEYATPINNLSNNTWRYAGFIWDGESNPTYWHRSNGAGGPEQSQSNVLNNITTASNGTAVIGHIQNLLNGGYDTNESFQGDLAEIVVFDGKVNKAMLRMMNTYFRNKYTVGGTGAWDKLQAPAGYREGLIMIGRDGGSNSEHRYSRGEGLVLRTNPGGLQGSHPYFGAGTDLAMNNVVYTNLPGDVQARWNRTWWMRAEGVAGSSNVQIAFDFGEGIGGEFPLNAENYVLLWRSNTSSNFSERAVTEKSITDDEVVFRLTGTQLANGYYTIGTKDELLSSLTGQTIRTWYAYQSGDWSNPDTWTLDGSAAPYYVNPAGVIPSSGDAIYIGSGRTVTADIASLNQSSLKLFGTLDLNTLGGHNYNNISGSGVLRCAGSGGTSNFPLGTTTDFANPNTGGTVEFYGGGFTQSNDLLVNKLKINLNTNGSAIILAADLTHNGFFEINKGTLTVNNGVSVSRTITSNAKVLVESDGSVNVHAVNRKHTWNFERDFVNEGGDIRFTNRTVPNYTSLESSGWIDARFISGTANQELIANGTTLFSRLVVNKGADDTYVLSVTSDGANKFQLLGYAGKSFDTPQASETVNTNAVCLVYGTLRAGEHIFLPLHVNNGNYCINEASTLWIDGGIATKGDPIGTTSTAIVAYGKIRITDGAFNANCNSGITIRDNGIVQVDGGVLNANQIRTSVFGPENIGGLIINGGIVSVDGTRPGGANGSYYTFSLTYPGNLFRMTGGALEVSGPSSRGLIFINSNPEQTSVTGGTIYADVKNTSTTHRISSRAAFWNLEISRSNTSGTNRPIIITGGDSFGEVIQNQPLVINNSLKITGANAPTLQMKSIAYGSIPANEPIDLHLQGNLIIENGGVYAHDLNTTYFDGQANSLLALPTASTQTFRNVVVRKTDDTRFAEIQSGNSTNAMEVLGDFFLEKGSFINNNRHVLMRKNVTNRGTIGNETSTGLIRMHGVSGQQEIISENGIFHSLNIDNPDGVRLINDGLRFRRALSISNGNFFIGDYKVKLEGEFSSISTAPTVSNRMIVTSGSASAGGLEIFFKTATQQQNYPIGVENGTNVKYTPAITRINNDFVQPGYIRIVPVDDVLASSDLTGGPDYLDFYWKVSHSEFDPVPRVSHRFNYNLLDVQGNPANFASGRVLADDPFTRQVDSLNNAVDHVITGSRLIFYNGETDGNILTGTGTLLVNASYSAGNKERFSGRPRVFFSVSNSMNANWNNASHWSELGEFSAGDGVFQYHAAGSSNTEIPGPGDIAYIGFNPSNGKPHCYEAFNANINVAELRFTQLQDAGGNRLSRYYQTGPANLTVMRPMLSFNNTADISNIREISGEGALLLRGNVDLNITDIGDFLTQDSSIVILQPTSGQVIYTQLPATVPNVFVTSSNDGAGQDIIRISRNTYVRGNLEIAGNANLQIENGPEGDIRIGNNLILDKYQALTSSPELRFFNNGIPRTVDVRGNLIIRGNGAQVRVISANTTLPQTIHHLKVWKDIYQNAPASIGLNLSQGPTHDFVALELPGTGNHSFINDNGLAPNLGRITVSKGTDINSSFSFNSHINLNGPTNLPEKAILLKSGLLSLDYSTINITLSNGGGDFVIPSESGLELNNGTLRITGQEIGMILSGRLNIGGGLLQIGNTAGENNYLEYSASGSAEIDISGGVLSVGSQLRRGLTNTEGVLQYTQSGGELLVGVNSAPNANRGVFEVVNSGSSFDFSGGKITLVRGVNSSTTPSFHVDTENFTTTGAGILVVGNTNSPTGAPIQNVGLKSNVPLNLLEINNDSGNNPVAKLYVSDLKIHDLLEIKTGATLDCNSLNLIVNGNILNNGSLLATDGKLTLDHTAINSIGGTGIYEIKDFERIGQGITQVSTDLSITNNFSLDNGLIDFGSASLYVKGNVSVDGHLQFLNSSQGLVMDGTSSQLLRRTLPGNATIDILTIDNPAGINLIPSAGHVFDIQKQLRMKRGIFDLRGNLLELGLNATIEQVNAFGQNNMISTGGAFTNFGVRKAVPANSNQDVFMPLGIDKYMPIRLIFSDIGFSSGNQASTYLFRLSIPQHSIIVQDSEAPDPQINDLLNVLQMYFYLEAANVGANLRMDAEFTYDQDYVTVTAPYDESDYIGARVVDNSPVPDVFKFTEAVNELNNIISLSFSNVTAEGITGDYFAGIDNAIPNNVPLYVTQNGGGVVTNGNSGGTYAQTVPGGGAPNGAVVQIIDNHVLDLNVNGINFYKTIIEEDATLEIPSTSFHRLGIVEGTGTIRLVSSGTIPSGVYNDFFTCGGGKIEYSGTGNHEILANIPIVRNVTLTGSGQRNLSNNDVNICENLVVNGPTFQNSNAALLTVEDDLIIENGTYNNLQGFLDIKGDLVMSGGNFVATNLGSRTIRGDINMSAGTFNMGSGSQVMLKGNFNKTGGTLLAGSGTTNRFILNGDQPQIISGLFTTGNNFLRLELDNASGLTLDNHVYISTQLLLTDGKIHTGQNSLIRLMSNATSVAPNGGSPESFVNGPMEWELASSTSSASLDRIFPVGKNDRYRPAKLSNRSVARVWTVEYVDTVATIEPLVQNLTPYDPIVIKTMSKMEYWKINSNSAAATTARVGLSWGENSVVAPAPADYNKLVVMGYNASTSVWDSYGALNNFPFDATTQMGSFISQNPVGFSEKFLTLGSSDAINVLPVQFLFFAGETNGIHHTLKWATASETNNDYFQLERSLDGMFFQTIGQVAGAGSSVERNDYSYVDMVAPSGRVYYRLKQVDFDGKNEYAPEIVTLVKEERDEPLEFVIYPNPTIHKEVRLMISDFSAEMALITLTDLSGKTLVRKVLWIDEQGISDTFACDFEPGVYIVSVIVDNSMRSKPLVISK